MGDETYLPDRPATRSSPQSSTDKSPRTRKLWRSMTDLYGARWLETYGDEPSAVWTNQIEPLTDAQVKQALQTILKSASAHPPSLPEFLGYARNVRPAAPPTEGSELTPAERLAGRWFLHRSVRFRFVGMTLDQHRALRERAVEICSGHVLLIEDADPSATDARVLKLLDEVAEEIYPAAHAKAWMAKPPKLEELKENLPKTPHGTTSLRYGRFGKYDTN